MDMYNLCVTNTCSPTTKTPVSRKFVDMLRRHLISLPPSTIVANVPNPAYVWRTEELLLPKQSYDDVLNRVQELLRDDSVAGDVVTLVEAIESEHIAIMFTPKPAEE